MSTRDPELTRLLVQELRRHLAELRAQAGESAVVSPDSARRAVHALKGSAGLAGEPELAGVMLRLERRLAAGETGIVPEVLGGIERAIERLSAGQPAVESVWPVPPLDLVPRTPDPIVRTQYLAEISDRLAKIDALLSHAHGSSLDVVHDLYRHVHTMKGAASAVSDEPMAWFCHGLEERLREGQATAESAERAVDIVAEHRAILGSLLDDPLAALAALRGRSARDLVTSPASKSQSPAADGERRDSFRDELRYDERTVRVAAQSIDSLIDHIGAISLARERIAVRVVRTSGHANRLRQLRRDLTEAQRLIGPPRPWGAPASALRQIERTAQVLADLGDLSDGSAEELEASTQSLYEHALSARRLLSTMRQTPIRGMFARIEAAALAEARRAGCLVKIRTLGADESIDRRLAERLVEPCLQLARNAIAHGIEPPATREAAGKPPEATLVFRAQRLGSRLSVSIEDDGAGVDVSTVRARAIEAGIVTDVLADAADDQTLLDLLFLPGFSTRAHSPNLLAGRGVGLDITLSAVQKLGGTIRLSSRRGGGFQARLDIPIESGLANVVWVTADGAEYAIAAAHARTVRRNELCEAERIPHLAACLEPGSLPPAEFTIDLDVDLDGRELLTLGVDSVGTIEGVLVRELSPLVRAMGPFAGVIVRGDGSLRLALDVNALAPRARALVRVPEGRVSERPPTSRRSWGPLE